MAAQDALLPLLESVRYARGQVLISRGGREHGVFFISRGSAEIRLTGQRPGGSQTVTRGAGCIVGERAALTDEAAIAEVLARTDVTALRIDRHSFQRLVAQNDEIRNAFAALVEVRDRSREIQALLRALPLLRGVDLGAIEQLMEASRVRRLQDGELLSIHASRFTYLVLGGVLRGDNQTHAQAHLRNAEAPLVGVGELVGLHTDEPGQYRAMHGTVLLELRTEAFQALAARTAQRHAAVVRTVDGATGLSPGRRVILVQGATAGAGQRAIAYGLAATLATQADASVALICPVAALSENAGESGPFGDKTRLIERTSKGGNTLAVFESTADVEGLRVLLATVLRTYRTCVWLGKHLGPDREPGCHEADTLVCVATHSDAFLQWPEEATQRRIFVLRGQAPVAELATEIRCLVRLPEEAAVVPQWMGASFEPASTTSAVGRALQSLGRAVLGRSVGVALGGGGAWGIAHVALLRRLAEAKIPVDYVSGSSFGLVVGAIYCARRACGTRPVHR